MTDGVEFDFTELRNLAAMFDDATPVAKANVRKALQVTSQHVKEDWRKGARRSMLGPYAGDVTYETEEKANEVTAEIGPTPGDAGSLGIMEDAPGGVKSAPQHAGRDAARRNEADFIKGVLIAASEPLEGP